MLYRDLLGGRQIFRCVPCAFDLLSVGGNPLRQKRAFFLSLALRRHVRNAWQGETFSLPVGRHGGPARLLPPAVLSMGMQQHKEIAVASRRIVVRMGLLLVSLVVVGGTAMCWNAGLSHWAYTVGSIAGGQVVLANWLGPQERDFRTFRDQSGKYELEAKLVEYRDSKVVLERRDGSLCRVPMDALSATDQAYVQRELRADRRQLTSLDNPRAEPEAIQWETAANWRGEDRLGVFSASGLLDLWPASGPPLVWKASGFGKGNSSVAVRGEWYYTMGQVDGDTKMVAAKVADGQIVWAHTVRSGDDAPNCTPLLDGDLVFGLGVQGDLVCCHAETGQEVWRKNLAQDLGGQMMSEWGYSETPLIDGDKLICTPGAPNAMLAALDKRTGNLLWTTSFPPNVGPAGKNGAGYSSPVISHGGGVKQYVQLVGRGLIGVEAKTGRLLWGYNRIANGTANVPTPLVSGDYVFCSTGYRDGGSALLKLSPSSRGVSAAQVYYFEGNRMQNTHGGMVMIGAHIYMGEGHNNGFPLCFNWKTGRDAWRPGRGPGTGSAAVSCADGHLYFRYSNGVMALIEATPESYRVKGEFRLASQWGDHFPHPVIYDGRLYIRDKFDVLCYDVAK